MKKRKGKKRKVFYTMFYTYVGLLIMPIVLTCTVSMIALGTLLSNSLSSSNAAAEQTANIIDSHIENSFTYAATILTNNYTTTLRYKNTYNGADLVDMKQLQSFVRQLTSQTFLISEFYVLFNASGYVLSSNNMYGPGEFVASAESNLHISGEELDRSLQFRGTQRSCAYPYEHGPEIIKNTIYLVNKNIAVESRENSGVIVIAVINPDRLSSVLSSFTKEDGIDLLIKTQEDNFINTKILKEDEAKVSKLSDINTAGIKDLIPFTDNEDYYKAIDSNVNDWSYYYIISSTGYITTLRYIMLFSMILLLVGGIGGLVFCYGLTKKQYSPLQMLVDRMIYVADNNQNADTNEFELIERSLTSLVNQNKLAHTQIDEYKTSLSDNVLKNCLLGYVRAGDTIETLNAEYNLGCKSERFAVIIYNISEISPTLLDENSEPVEYSLELLYSFVSEVVNNYSLDDCKKWTFIIKDDIVCLINLSDDTIEKDVRRMAEETAAYLKEKYSFTILASISNINPGVQGITAAYSECYEVIEYLTLLGYHDRIQSFSEMKQSLNAGAAISLSNISLLEQQYLNCMKAADFKKALEIQDEIIDLYFNQESGSVEQVKYRLHRIINTTISALEDIKGLFEDNLYDRLHPYERILASQDFIGFRDVVKDIYNELSENFDEKKELHNIKRNMDMVEYVNENFTNSELNIAMMSDTFAMSPAHISRTFKKASGKGLLEYIHLLRIEKAKECMASTNMSMKNIAEEVGYTNSLTMIRAFHRYEGITPGEYKDAIITRK